MAQFESPTPAGRASVPGTRDVPTVEISEAEQEIERERMRRNRMRRARVVAVVRLAFIVGVLGLWEFASDRWIDSFIFSSPSAVLQRLYHVTFVSGELWRHAGVTFSQIAIGYPIGSILGIATGYAFGRSQDLADTFEPVVMAIYGIPRTALAPLFIIWLGIGIWSKVGIVILMTFFLTFFNTYSGMKGMDMDYIRLSRLMGASEGMITRRVILPAVFPSILVGLKTSVPQSVIGATVGEFIASTAGLGFLVRRAAQLFDAPTLFVGVVALCVFVLVANALLTRLERIVMRWKPVEEGRLQS